jgi:hypothetical protein
MAEDISLIPYDRMKEQIEKEVMSFIAGTAVPGEIPAFSYEKGTTVLSFPIPAVTERVIFLILSLMKDHLENVRIHALGDGYYAFQAMNRNLFKTENLLDNLKVELFAVTGKCRAEVSKKGNLSQEEVNTALGIYKLFFEGAKEDPKERLRKLGASVFSDNTAFEWGYIAGYEDVKKQIRESIVLPLQNPEIFDAVARLTRRSFESNRPKAILFEGAPGVGKTTVSRIIAADVKVPLVYVPVESIMSKWYGQSSQNLSQIFDACEDLGSAILFIDEIDSLAGSRDGNMFEATRRILSVLLRRLDGLDAVSNTLTIGATNRKNDLDNALLSRFDQTIHFPLPNASERAAIFGNYAKHLTLEELSEIGQLSDGLSGRNIKDLCEYTERRWARKLIMKKIEPRAPTAEFYRNSIVRISAQ